MLVAVHAAYPSFVGTFNVGIAVSPATIPARTFVWAGTLWSGSDTLWRFAWSGLACLIPIAAAFFFSRFDPAIERRTQRVTKKPSVQEQERFRVAEDHLLGEPVHLTPLGNSSTGIAAAWGTLRGELRVLGKEVPRWWYIGACLWIGLCLFYPSYALAHGIFLPVAWLWPLPIWSSLGNRERQHHTDQLVFSAERILSRQFPMLYVAGVCVSLFTASGMILRILLAGDSAALLALLLGALFIPAFALCTYRTFSAW
jgi:hypothetical protein